MENVVKRDNFVFSFVIFIESSLRINFFAAFLLSGRLRWVSAILRKFGWTLRHAWSVGGDAGWGGQHSGECGFSTVGVNQS